VESLEKLLLERHPLPEWATFTELSQRTGYSPGRIDVAAFNVWQSKKFLRIAYEVKKSKGDFRRELKNPDKRAWVEESFNETYFCCEQNVADKEEIPDGWGLLVRTKDGTKIRRVKVARYRDVGGVDEHTFLALLRRICSQMSDLKYKLEQPFKLDGREITSDELNAKAIEAQQAYRQVCDETRRKTAKEHERLIRERDALREPFRRLLKMIGKTSYYQVRREVEDVAYITQHLDGWIQQTQQKLLSGLETNLMKTRYELDMAIEQIREQREELLEEEQC
jgi:hypothetical protein